MKKLVVLCALAGAALAACGSDSNNAAPTLIAGGGVGSGAINGTLNVYVIDSQSKAPISGASVTVAGQTMAMTTDATGLAVFKGGSLKGPQTITVTSGTTYAASTWIGADGANVTIPIDLVTPVQPDSASVSGTIAGWDSLPMPAMGHYYIALVYYSWTEKLGDPANSIPTPGQNIGGMTLPGNACVKIFQPIMFSQCSWQLKTRTGAQTHVAIILDADSKGTATNINDDTYTVYGYATKTGLNLTKDQMVSNETLDMLADTDLQSVTLGFPTAPAGLSFIAALPAIDLGTEMIVFPVPGLTPMATTQKAPKLTGAFSSGTYNVIGIAQADKMTASPSTLQIQKNVNLGATYTLPDFLPTPTNVSASGGTYSFAPAAGAAVHTAKFTGANGKVAWNVALLDDSMSFMLPSLNPDALPAGMDRLTITAVDIPSFDATNFSLDAIQNTLKRSSENHTDFTH